MSRVIACLPLNELVDGSAFLSRRFENARIMLNHSQFDDTRGDVQIPQILLYVEEDFSQNDNIFRLLACRGFNYLFFSKSANPNWAQTLVSGRLEEETERFILWCQQPPLENIVE